MHAICKDVFINQIKTLNQMERNSNQAKLSVYAAEFFYSTRFLELKSQCKGGAESSPGQEVALSS